MNDQHRGTADEHLLARQDVGFLHTDNYNKKSLVFDLIEPFRILGDRTTVLLFTGRRVFEARTTSNAASARLISKFASVKIPSGGASMMM